MISGGTENTNKTCVTKQRFYLTQRNRVTSFANFNNYVSVAPRETNVANTTRNQDQQYPRVNVHFKIKFDQFTPGYLTPATKLGQGYVFTGVCDSVHGGGLPQCMGCHTYPRTTPPRADTPREQTPPPGADTPPQEIWSMRGQYASYWNAILFKIKFAQFTPGTYEHLVHTFELKVLFPRNNF